ncbi:MAG: hypothetical protein A3I68_05620 [Candidatus Melainabacteria bacterium RIFCSPLOWO2_02_FULL_35_15]|nr:MAG: hypothetical protein A3I68_05620 [Candidatus Melainabacteria bacterium RIFCSPLOWO2_02_FULL_35_15]
MKLFIVKDKKTGDKKAFEIIKKQILHKPDSLIGLAAGKTINGLYKLVSYDAMKYPNTWKKIKIFQIDENFGINSDSELSFNHQIKKKLKSLIKKLSPLNIFLIEGTKNPKKTISEGYRFLKKNGGIDLIILGIGTEYDPHIAYNTSGRSLLNSKMRVVDLHPKEAAKVTTQKGITLGIKDILNTKKVLLMAYGKEKAKSVKLAFKGRVDTKRASASALQLHKDLNIVTDKEAGKFLRYN